MVTCRTKTIRPCHKGELTGDGNAYTTPLGIKDGKEINTKTVIKSIRELRAWRRVHRDGEEDVNASASQAFFGVKDRKARACEKPAELLKNY